MSFEQDFQTHVLANLDKAEGAMVGYEFRGLRDLIDQHGAYAVAKEMVDISKIQRINSGLERLAEQGLLEYSLEQAIIDFESSGMFTRIEIDTARSRLILVQNKLKRKSTK